MSVTIYQHAHCGKCDSGFCEHAERAMARRKREETISDDCAINTVQDLAKAIIDHLGSDRSKYEQGWLKILEIAAGRGQSGD